MTVICIYGCELDLATLREDALFEIAEMIGRNLDQAERALSLLNQEINRRALNKSFDPPLLPAS
jgi:hypothetical protein